MSKDEEFAKRMVMIFEIEVGMDMKEREEVEEMNRMLKEYGCFTGWVMKKEEIEEGDRNGQRKARKRRN
jgi:hypothetical protein